MAQVGVIGLGLLGSAIAGRLLRAGYTVVGYDLSDERRAALAQAHGQPVDSAVAVAGACDTIVLSLPDSDVVAAVVAEIDPALQPNSLLIDTTTGDPAAAEGVGAMLDARGVQYLDATIAGSSAQVADGQVIVMAGGKLEAYERAGCVLSCFASQSFHVGSWGAGSRMKLVVNLVLGLHRAVLAEGLTLAEALGLDPQAALAILRVSAAYSKVMDTKGQKMLTEDFSPQARLSQHLKDVRLIVEAAERTGRHLPLSTLHRELLARAEAAGWGELDNSAVIRAVRAWADERQS